MGVIDWIILVILALSVFMGWRKGLVAAIINLAGYIMGFFLVSHFYPLIALSLRQKFGISNLFSNILGIILILVLMAVIVKLVIVVFNRVLKALRLSGINRFFGMLLGLANGLMLVICVMVVLDYFPRTSTPLKDSSSHRVYSGINLLKEELFSNLRLKEQLKYLKLGKDEPANQKEATK